MTRHPYDPDCPDCRPVFVHQLTGTVLSRDSPEMRAADPVWDAAPLAERAAFINVTVHNSRATEDVALAQALAVRLTKAVNDATD